MPDVIVIGAGLSGCVFANSFARDGKKVLVLEKRNHTGGNVYENEMDHVRYHQYGPHIFHTKSEIVKNYMEEFGEWYFYEHRVLGLIDGCLVPIPFNFRSIETLFPLEKANKIKEKLLSYFEMNTKISIMDLIHHEDEDLKVFGEYVFDRVFLHYTAKQWNTDISNVDTSVINRVPVVIGYDDRYFSDTYQMMPKNGYNEIIDHMLNSSNIQVKLNVDAKSVLTFQGNDIFYEGKKFLGKVIFTGNVDALFDYCYGPLPYRSLSLQFECLDMNYYQPNAVINYPNEEAFTRITEFKYFQPIYPQKKTVILKEYPKNYDYQDEASIPYYAIINDENRKLYEKYSDHAKQYPNLILCGRLAEYKYYDMDAVILRALSLYEEVKSL